MCSVTHNLRVEGCVVQYFCNIEEKNGQSRICAVKPQVYIKKKHWGQM